MIRVVTLDESLHDRYTSYVSGRLDARFGHDLAWARTLHATYGVEPRHLVALNGERIVGICPFFLCKPLVGGAHYVTNPFPTYCGPLYDTDAVLNALLRDIRKKTLEVDHAEVLTPVLLSGVEAGLLPFHEALDVTFKLDLRMGMDLLHKNLRTNFKRILSKSTGLKGMEILIDLDGSLVDEFYPSYVRVYGQKHGFIPHIKALFRNIFEHFPKNDARLYMVRINGKYAGGIFTFWSHNEVYYAWSAVEPDSEYQPAHGMIWRIIQDAVSEEYDWFNMGEAPKTHETLIRFKQGWGTEMVQPIRHFIPGHLTQPTPRLFDRVGWTRTVIAKLPAFVISTFLSPVIRFFL